MLFLLFLSCLAREGRSLRLLLELRGSEGAYEKEERGSGGGSGMRAEEDGRNRKMTPWSIWREES